ILVFLVLSLLVLRRSGRQLFAKIGVPFGIVAALVLAVGSIAADKSLFSNDRVHTLPEETSDVRLDLWKAAIQEWQVQPIIGTGSGPYLFYGRQFRTDRIDRDPVDVHNDYLHLLAEYGIIGSAFFLFFLSAHLYRGWKNFRRLGPGRVASSGRLLSNSMALQIA